MYWRYYAVHTRTKQCTRYQMSTAQCTGSTWCNTRYKEQYQMAVHTCTMLVQDNWKVYQQYKKGLHGLHWVHQFQIEYYVIQCTLYMESAHGVLHTMHIVHYALQIKHCSQHCSRYNMHGTLSLVYYILLYISTLLLYYMHQLLKTHQVSKLQVKLWILTNLGNI